VPKKDKLGNFGSEVWGVCGQIPVSFQPPRPTELVQCASLHGYWIGLTHTGDSYHHHCGRQVI